MLNAWILFAVAASAGTMGVPWGEAALELPRAPQPPAGAPSVPLAPPSLEEELSAGIVRVKARPGVVEEAQAAGRAVLSEVLDRHFMRPISLPLGQGPTTHVAVYFGGDRKLRVAFTREADVRLYSIAELEAGAQYEAGGEVFRLRLRAAAHPWDSLLLISGSEEGSPVYPIRLFTLYENAWSEGVPLQVGRERLGSLLLYRDPYAVQARTFIALLPFEGPLPTAYLLVLEDLPEDGVGWAKLGSRRLGFKRTADGVEVLQAP